MALLKGLSLIKIQVATHAKLVEHVENQGRQFKNAHNRAGRAMIKETRSTADMQSLHEDITGHMHEDRTGVMHEEEVGSKRIGT